MKQDIGINQRIPAAILEAALLACIQGNGTADYFRQLASTEYQGQNRIGKAASVINRLTVKNSLFPYLANNGQAMESMLRGKADRTLILTAVICSAYCFGYDTVSLLGKYFHAQESVTTDFIREKMSQKYGSNRSLPNALYCVLPMLIEAGMIARPKPGIYKAVRIANASQGAVDIYRRSFLLNNPMLRECDDFMTNPYFEFLIL